MNCKIRTYIIERSAKLEVLHIHEAEYDRLTGRLGSLGCADCKIEAFKQHFRAVNGRI
jgi:hypothetical protein